MSYCLNFLKLYPWLAWIRRITIAFLLILCGTPVFSLELVRENRPVAHIITPANATKFEIFAAEELQVLLEKSTGAKLEILATDDIPTTPAVFIGKHPANSALAAKLNEFSNKYDRFGWESTKNALYITAPTNSALSYAVWDILEKVCGIEFLIPGENGFYIPKKNTVDSGIITVLEAPAFDFRSYSINKEEFNPSEHGFEAYEMFRYRSRHNMWQALDSADTYGWLGNGHSFNHYLPFDRYAVNNPEWYSMLADGKRKTVAGNNDWQLCLTNEESTKQFIANAIPEIENLKARGIPESRILLCTGANDTTHWCLCSKCVALRDPDGTWSSAMLNYSNLLAKELAKTHPEVKILHYVYQDYGRIPTKVKPEKQVVACITAWAATGSLAVNHTASMLDPTKNAICKSVTDYFAENADWVMNYGYYGHYTIFTPFPAVKQIAGDMRGLAAYPKVLGSLSESHNMWATQMPNFYIHTKMMWNPSLNEDRLLRNFCKKAYGPAGDLGYQYFQVLQKQMNSLSSIVGTTAEIPTILDKATLQKCRTLINSMVPLLGQMDEATRFRTQMIIDGFKVSDKFVEAMTLFNWGNGPAARNKILNNISWIDKYCQSPVGRFAFEYNMVLDSINGVRNGLAVDLMALPKGKSVFGGSLMWGGGVKFSAKAEGMRPEMWGYFVNGESGALRLNLRAIDGGKISKMEIWCVPDKSETDLYIIADGKEHLIASKLDNYQKVLLPEDLQGKNSLEVLFRCKVKKPGTYGLCGLNLEIEVE